MRAGFWCGYVKEGDHLEDLGVGRRIMLKMELQEVGLGGHALDWSGLGSGQVVGCCE